MVGIDLLRFPQLRGGKRRCMPAVFNKLGIKFSYPENWEVDEAEALEGGRSVTLYSPAGGAFWTVSVHPRKTDPWRLAKAAAKALKEEYDSLETEPVSENVAGVELVGYDFNFYCLDLTSTAAVRVVPPKRATYAIFYQAEDREFQEVEHVFQAMLLTLLRGLKG
jgi:hypothetical protein